eukprot:555866_1
MASVFFAFCLMITSSVSTMRRLLDPYCADNQCDSPYCFTSNTASTKCNDGQFYYCKRGSSAAYPTLYCGKAPTSYHVIVSDSGVTGYYSTWVISGPTDVQTQNNKPIYVSEPHNRNGNYIWWTGDDTKTWRLNKKLGGSELI